MPKTILKENLDELLNCAQDIIKVVAEIDRKGANPCNIGQIEEIAQSINMAYKSIENLEDELWF